jgi:two-component system, LytTR family, sensor kinase
MSQPQNTRRRPRTRGRSLAEAIWQTPLWAIPFAAFFVVLDEAHGTHQMLLYYGVSVTFAMVIRLALWVAEWEIVPRVARATGSTNGSPPLPIGIAIYGLSSLAASYLAAAIVHFTWIPGYLGSARSVLISGVFAAVFTVLVGGIVYAKVFYRLAIERARAVEQVRAELAQAELRTLRSQMNPHFLFNALNTIASMVREDPEAAEDTTTRLAELFRYALRASDRDHAPFGDELAFVRDYLAIERRRFGARLTVIEDIAPGIESVPVPTLLLQPLVENAVRHGIGPRAEGGVVRLSARPEGANLMIEVADDGPGFTPGARPSGNGFGLHSVRERLRAAGPPHALDIGPGPGACVRVTLPLLAGAVADEPVSLPHSGGCP